jgi:putative heme-binding domain-containing protein
VLPSVSFARGYEAFTAVTASGQVHTGVITRETPEAIYLFSTDRVETRVPRAEVETLAQSTVSIMPEGMEAQLNRQELADLIAFLQSLK